MAATVAVVPQEEEVQDSFTDDSAFDLDLACRESRVWIEAVLTEKFDQPETKEGFHEGLRNGQRLCRFINCIKPNSVRKINKMAVAFACMENITWFLGACRNIGLRDTQLFTSTDLYGGAEAGLVGANEAEKLALAQKDKERKLRDVCITIYWLGRAVREMKDYHGPQLNLAAFVKMSCTRCQDPITDEKYVVDGGRNFHTKCFFCDTCGKNPIDQNEDFKWDSYREALACSLCRCVKCRDPLPKGGYRQLDDEGHKICPRCDSDNQCTTCKALLEKDHVHTHEGKKYCPLCVCADPECGKPFKAGKFTEIDGQRYCPDCLCFNCHGLAGKDHVNIAGRKYCPNCYCAERTCKKPFVNNKFKEIDGKRYCPDCLCANCEQLAGDKCVIEHGKKYCPMCYCADQTCKKPFKNNQFKEVDGKRYCPDCMCHRPGCDQWAGEDPIVHNGKKYCPNCVCADEECRRPFKEDKPDGTKDYIEHEGKRYCSDCMCHRPGCGKYAGKEPVLVDGKRFCPTCVCADEDCHMPLEDGKFTNVPAQGDFKGGNVCKSCLCAICECFVGKDYFLRRKGDRFCKNCCCGGCKIPLRENVAKTMPEKKNPDHRSFCSRCVCANCQCGLRRKDPRKEYAGKQYCEDCVCGICSKALVGARAEGTVSYDQGKACTSCQCAGCHSAVVFKDRIAFGPAFFCKACVCTACNKPASDVRGALTQVAGKTYCPACLCFGCKEPLGTFKMEFADHHYCKNCVCASCHRALGQDTRVSRGDKNYCATCVCVQCETVLVPGQRREFGDMGVCTKCACARCSRPEAPKNMPAEQPFIKARGKKFCVNCVCGSCDKPLEDNEVEYCTDCTCQGCGSLLDDDEKTFCDDCGASKPGFKPRAVVRKEKKAPKVAAAPTTAASTNSRPTSTASTPTSAPSSPSMARPGSVSDHGHTHKHDGGCCSSAPKSPQSPKAPAPVAKEGGCAKCGGALHGSVVRAVDKEFHADCFKCFMCNGALKGGFMAHEGLPYCSKCIGKAAGLPECGGCGQTVSGSYLTFGNGSAWHKECFKCSTCFRDLAGASNFRIDAGSPVCATCYNKN